jgi:hypothetical protein
MILYSKALQKVALDNFITDDVKVTGFSYSQRYNNFNKETTHRLEIKTKPIKKDPTIKFGNRIVTIDGEEHQIYVQNSLNLNNLHIKEDFEFIVNDDQILEIRKDFFGRKYLAKR